jgi:hypothetical protein
MYMIKQDVQRYIVQVTVISEHVQFQGNISYHARTVSRGVRRTIKFL